MRLALLVLALTGCGSLTLRPVQRDHAVRMAEVRERLGTDDVHLMSMIALTQSQCDRLDNAVTGITAASIGAGILAGGSGLSSIFTDATPRIAVATTGVVLSVAAAVLGYTSTALAQKYARKCAVNTGGQ